MVKAVQEFYGFLQLPPTSPDEYSWMSETLSISAALRENTASSARQEGCLWVSAEGGEPVCLSVKFPVSLGLHLSEMEDDHVPMLPLKTTRHC